MFGVSIRGSRLLLVCGLRMFVAMVLMFWLLMKSKLKTRCVVKGVLILFLWCVLLLVIWLNADSLCILGFSL